MFEYNGSRIAFSLFGIDVYWYGLLIVSGMVLAIALIANELKKQEQDPDLIYDLSLWVIPAAIIGARLWYVIFEFDRYDSILEMINVRDGGLAIQGGIIAGVISGYIFSKRKKLNFIKLADLIFIFLPLAQAIGRWGNFINNEAYGYETNLPWAVIIDGKSYHPTFFYESLSNFILSMVLWYLYRNKKLKDGTTTSLYLIFYGIIRFFVEGLRTDSLYWGPIRVAQLISIVFILLGIVLLVYMNSKKKKA
ncbi:prolipoprotein diacylglyceryl transferase [Helcococcus massiliensis]|uniref:prolipoprotein diacylglyceryl transferase n=1 Tax=Helcococcus massiliensis TaxID=2040290 RepID=UPI000CDF160C|nr:prolipoprotein diacylglyceryl transferase [Helcococcus massiliensis]